jgi:hypothetical protein
MNHETIVTVLKEAFKATAISTDSKHAGRRVSRELDPSAIQRMELRVNDGAREWDHTPF